METKIKMIPEDQHQQELQGLQGVIQQKDNEIEYLQKQVQGMSASLQSLMDDFRKSKNNFELNYVF